MTRCQYASSGCNGPKEGECMGLCMNWDATTSTDANDGYVVVFSNGNASCEKVKPLPIEYAGEESDDNGFSAMQALAYAMVFSFGVALAFGLAYVFFW